MRLGLPVQPEFNKLHFNNSSIHRLRLQSGTELTLSHPLGRRSQVRRTDVKPCFLESRPVSELIRGDKTFNQLINASISSGSTGVSAIRSTGPCSVTSMSFSNRTPIPSSGM